MAIQITITETATDSAELSDVLREIADLVDAGYTSGYGPNWEISEAGGEEAQYMRN